MGGIDWPFNSSNTAPESAAVTSNAVAAEKWRFCFAGMLESSTTLPSERIRRCVWAEVEIERSSGTELPCRGSFCRLRRGQGLRGDG
jgi:hypothetical protein